MAILLVVAAWVLLAPLAAVAVSAALRVADRAERSTPEGAEPPCPADAHEASTPEPVGAAAPRA